MGNFDTWLAGLASTYRHRVLPVTTEIADAWGRLDVPDRLPVVDGLIAATALVHHLTVVTPNIKHFERTGVPLLNPFELKPS